MKKYLLSISFLVITLSVLFTLMNCSSSDDPTPAIPCVKPKAPVLKTSITINAGQSISLTATSTETDPTYKWTGPNNFTSAEQNPTIANATEAMAGNYLCTVTVKGCTSLPDTTIVLIQGVMTDPKDGKVYKTIIIGTQTWMAENLRWQDPQWYADYKIYNDLPALGTVYGVLYNWNCAVKTTGGLTALGWRLPTDADWQKMVNYLGGLSVAGSKLKEAGLTHWAAPNVFANNSSGFTALGSGYYDEVVTNSFLDLKNRTYFWSSTPYETYMVIMILRVDDMESHREWGDKSNFYSVRLIKN